MTVDQPGPQTVCTQDHKLPPPRSISWHLFLFVFLFPDGNNLSIPHAELLLFCECLDSVMHLYKCF
jgi:hypothetical protein